MTLYFLYFLTFFNPSLDSVGDSVDEYNDSESIKWYTWEEAYDLSKTAPKKVFIDLYTDWCGWCKKMDATTFQDPEVIKFLNDNFYAVKFDAEQKEAIVFGDKTYEFMPGGRKGVHQLAYALLDGRMGYPAFVMLDESYARILISPGYKQGPQLMKELAFAKEEAYKSMSFDDFASKAE